MFRKKIDNYHKAIKLIEERIDKHKEQLEQHLELQRQIDVDKVDTQLNYLIETERQQMYALIGLLDAMRMSIGP